MPLPKESAKKPIKTMSNYAHTERHQKAERMPKEQKHLVSGGGSAVVVSVQFIIFSFSSRLFLLEFDS